MKIINRLYTFSPKQNVDEFAKRFRKVFNKNISENSLTINILEEITISPGEWKNQTD